MVTFQDSWSSPGWFDHHISSILWSNLSCTLQNTSIGKAKMLISYISHLVCALWLVNLKCCISLYSLLNSKLFQTEVFSLHFIKWWIIRNILLTLSSWSFEWVMAVRQFMPVLCLTPGPSCIKGYAIQLINRYLADKWWQNIQRYPPDRVLPSG